ncbi:MULTISPECIES: hypothetical protein [Ramlibacter]|uniref:Uncharacterized protein n=1 Tax=Ramlibacter aquaticus TaxID=2780094 RepID=A0ABR9S9K6_9BURK|nr:MULTISPECIES: hypothetical protein [Ramlibacter]MBE7939003.1 hypothetical protein [Ramlibacter aquaticus]
MTEQPLSQTATEAVASLGRTAHELIDLYREGGESIAQTLGAQWDSAFAAASPQLSAESRRNAQRTRALAGQLYAQGLALSSGGAQLLVDTLVGATIAGIHFAAAPRKRG